MTGKCPQESQQQQRTTAIILDEYCRYYSDFSIYIRNFYPELHFDLEQLLDASYNVWHRLTDEEKISLATFLEEMSEEQDQTTLSTSTKMKTFNGLINSELLAAKLNYSPPGTGKSSKVTRKPLALNTSSYVPPVVKSKKLIRTTPFQIYLKDERDKYCQKHRQMPMRDINKRLSERWQKMSQRMKEKYEYRSRLAKKRLERKLAATAPVHGTNRSASSTARPRAKATAEEKSSASDGR